jgi:EAL domain-containing protein (putative c-di-GMP-specific phosphodiesterase class I)
LDNQLHQDLGAPFRHPLATAARLLPPLGRQVRRLQPVATPEERARHLLRFVVDGFGFDAGVILAVEPQDRSLRMVEHNGLISAEDAIRTATEHLGRALEAQRSHRLTGTTEAAEGDRPDHEASGAAERGPRLGARRARRTGTSADTTPSVAIEITVADPGHGTLGLTMIPVLAPGAAGRDTQHVIVLIRVPGNSSLSIEIDESMARVFSGVVASLLGGRIRDLQDIEETALDSLRIAYNNLPAELRSYRLELFHRRLNEVEFGYQPIFDIRGRPQVQSWEALARYRDEPSSPSWLFETARVWGRDFQLAADLHALDRATAVFTGAAPRRPHLAVNVAANTISEDGYLHRCQEILAAAPQLTLALEISEKSEFIDLREDGQAADTSEDSSMRLAAALVPFRDIGCLVAMDDFGAQFSSIVRALALRPDHLKVDRGVVTSPTPHPTLRFAQEFAIADNSQVIAEGVETRPHLVRVCAAGIGLVQGFLFGRAVPEPKTPSAAHMARITRHLEVARGRADREADTAGQ